MNVAEWLVLLGLIAFIVLIAKRYYDDVVLDHSFRALYVETRTKLASSLLLDLMKEMETLKELERIAVFEGTPPKHAARLCKRAAVSAMAAHLRLQVHLRNLS